MARIPEATGHAEWAAKERAAGTLPPSAGDTRQALCGFRKSWKDRRSPLHSLVGDPESRYWQARAASKLALAAFERLDQLPDSGERIIMGAALARGAGRFVEHECGAQSGTHLRAGQSGTHVRAPPRPTRARDYNQTIATLEPMLHAGPDNAQTIPELTVCAVQLRRPDDAVPMLRRAAERDGSDDGTRLALARASLQQGDFDAAIALIESQLAGDRDGSLHVQLARAYKGTGQREKADACLRRPEALQRVDQERAAQAAGRTITSPK